MTTSAMGGNNNNDISCKMFYMNYSLRANLEPRLRAQLKPNTVAIVDAIVDAIERHQPSGGHHCHHWNMALLFAVEML